jgi:glycerate-2-kinase
MGVVGTKVVVMGTVRVELSRVAGGGLAKREWGFFCRISSCQS